MVTDNEIARVLAAASRHSVRDGRAVLHSLPIGYALDAATGIREPRGMLGHRFGVDMHMVTAEVATVRNLMLTVERSHLCGRGHGGLALCGRLWPRWPTTSPIWAPPPSIWAPERPLWRYFPAAASSMPTVLPSAGPHVTMDVARGLNTRIADAERIKAIYGSVLTGGSDERDMITVPPVGDDEREPPQFVSRAALVRIIKPRVEEILEMVRDRLAASPFAAEPRGRVVLTGGASQLVGIADLAVAHPEAAGAHRPPARHCRAAGGGQGAGLRGRGGPAGLPAGGTS